MRELKERPLKSQAISINIKYKLRIFKPFNFLKAFLALSLIILLTSCDQQADYRTFMLHPEELQSTLQTCSNSQQTTKSCQLAQAVRQAIAIFLSVQQEQSLRFPNAQQEMSDYQQLVQRAAHDEKLRDQIQSELAGVNLYYQSVAQNYSKRIMGAEIALSDCTNHYKQIKQSIKGRKPTSQELSQLQDLESTIAQTQQLIQAMLTLVHVNTGGQD